MRRHPFAGAIRAKPTKKHRLAMWECMLGTVYATDGTEVKYFDYDWEGARSHAGIDKPTADPRLARVKFPVMRGPKVGSLAVYVIR